MVTWAYELQFLEQYLIVAGVWRGASEIDFGRHQMKLYTGQAYPPHVVFAEIPLKIVSIPAAGGTVRASVLL